MDIFANLCTSAVGRLVDVTIREIVHSNGLGVAVTMAIAVVVAYIMVFRHLHHVRIVVKMAADVVQICFYAMTLAVYTWSIVTGGLVALYTFSMAVYFRHGDTIDRLADGVHLPQSIKYSLF
jgi:hypothetical protein